MSFGSFSFRNQDFSSTVYCNQYIVNRQQTLPNTDLIARCLRKDTAAEKELYYAYAKRIYGLCRRYTRDDHQAKDYMQESFHKVFQNLHKFDAAKGSFESWILTITTNTILSDKNRKRLSVVYDDYDSVNTNYSTGSENIDLIEMIGYDISHDELLAAIRQLPADYRDILNLYIFENWTHEDIAAKMNIQASSSRSKLTRAKQLLKKTLIKHKTLGNYEGEVA